MADNIRLIRASLCYNDWLAQRMTLYATGVGEKDASCYIVSGGHWRQHAPRGRWWSAHAGAGRGAPLRPEAWPAWRHAAAAAARSLTDAAARGSDTLPTPYTTTLSAPPPSLHPLLRAGRQGGGG